MGLVIYNLLLPIYLAISLPGLALKMKRRGGYGRHFGQRFGWYDRELRAALHSGRRPWWIHAVSVGEVLIALKLIDRSRELCPAQPLILSTTSSTGYATAREKAPPAVRVIYNPVDLPGVVQSALAVIRPGLIVLMESEMWPNLIAAASRRGIPVAIANARLSPRSGRRYAAFRRLVTPTLNRLTEVMTQEEGDAEGWLRAGLRPEKIHRVGSIKFDPSAWVSPDAAQVTELEGLLRGLWGGEQPIYKILLGSSHAGEEAAVTRIYLKLRQDFPQVRLLLVPRHFERAAAVQEEVETLGIPVVRRSQSPLRVGTSIEGKGPPVLLVDTTGELRAWYVLADAVVVGKSFLSEGGQNPVEPIMAGCPVVTGPHMENFAGLMDLLKQAGGLRQVDNLEALETTLRNWVGPGDGAKGLAAAGQTALEAHAGATDRTVEKLLAITAETA